MKNTNVILIVLSSWAGGLAFARWQISISAFLDPINPHLLDVIFIVLFVATLVVWLTDRSRNSSEMKTHSKKFIKEIEILSEGHYGYHLDKIEFLIPYPYSEYKESERRMWYPTHTEVIELFNKSDWSNNEPQRYDFVPTTKSPEGNFKEAIEHLESYKDINKMFDESREITDEFETWLKKHELERNEIQLEMFNVMKQRSSENKDFSQISHPMYSEFTKLSDNYSNSLSALQKSLKKLASNLEDGKTIQGKCSQCP